MKKLYLTGLVAVSIVATSLLFMSCNGKAAKAGVEAVQKVTKSAGKGAKYADDIYRAGASVTAASECATCGGTGVVYTTSQCYNCEGYGTVGYETCPICYGTGQLETTYYCPTCNGTGEK